MAAKQQEKWGYQRKPRKCPECGATQFAKYLYGMVDYPGIEQDLAEGKIAIGGCDITRAHEGKQLRAWCCNQCGVDLFRHEQNPSVADFPIQAIRSKSGTTN
jgi:ribosomal protein L37AE/L43A